MVLQGVDNRSMPKGGLRDPDGGSLWNTAMRNQFQGFIYGAYTFNAHSGAFDFKKNTLMGAGVSDRKEYKGQRWELSGDGWVKIE